jgi:virginiamycin B lyase
MEKKSGMPAMLAAFAAASAFLTGAPLSAQAFVEYPLPTAAAGPRSIVAGPDGNLWFTEADAGKIGRITPEGSVVEYPLPSPTAEPWRIAAGPDGALWFTEMAGNRIGRIAASGVIDEFDVPTPKSLPRGIAAGADGALWFTEREANRIGRITPQGDIREYGLAEHTGPDGIAAGADGALWFAETYAGRAGRLTTAGAWTETGPLPDSGYPEGIAASSDGGLWVTTVPGAGGSAVRIPPSGAPVAHAITPYTPGDPAIDASGNLWFASSDGTIGKLDPKGRLSKFTVPTEGAYPAGIAIGPDGKIWFTESASSRIGRLDPAATASCTAPAAPTLSVDGGSEARVAPGEPFTLTWTAVLGTGGGNYVVSRSTGGGLGWTGAATTPGTALTMTALPEQAGATILFEVRATRECGASSTSSGESNAVTVSVSGGPPPPPSAGCASPSSLRPCIAPAAPPSPAAVAGSRRPGSAV